MTWFLVDDQYPTDTRILATSLAARGLWVTAGAWSSAHRTDVVPDHVLAALGSTPELEAELRKARVWKRVKGGCQFEQPGLCKLPSRETVDKQREMKTERQRRWRESQRRRGVDASTDASTWIPVPSPIPGFTADVVNQADRSNGARASPETIDAVKAEIRDTAGRVVDDAWAARVAADILQGRSVASPAAYIRQAIRREPRRFTPTTQPPPVAEVLAASDDEPEPRGRHARKDTP